MKKKIISTISILIILFLSNMVFASEESEFTQNDLMYIEVNGVGRIITKTTTADDIKEWYGGSAKVETDSLWGGKAYSFYIGDKYDDYLFIETLENGQIFSYGSVDASYKTNKYSYGSAYPYNDNSTLIGDFIREAGIIKGGIYYNKSILYNGKVSKIKEFFETEFLKDETKAILNLNKHSVVLWNAIEKTYNNESAFLTFNEEYFYINNQLNNFGTTLQAYMGNMEYGYSKYESIGTQKNVELSSNSLKYFLSPIRFGGMASSNKNIKIDEKKYPVWNYDYENKILAGAIFTPTCFQRPNEVPLTAEELYKLDEGRKEYKQAIEYLNKSEEIYKVNPQYDTPENLVAGELTQDKKEGITHYMNAIRVANGLQKLELDEYGFNMGQHLATLNAYRYTKLNLQSSHYPFPIPDGVSREFWETAVGYGGYSWNNDVSDNKVGSLITPEIMMKHINSLIDDRGNVGGKNSAYGHRLDLLKPNVNRFGYGICSINCIVETTSKDNYANQWNEDLVAWPSANGITFLEILDLTNDFLNTTKFVWNAKFNLPNNVTNINSNYEVLNSTTAKIECLNTGEIWNFDKEEDTYNRKYQNLIDGEVFTSISNNIIMYDSSIEPCAGYVYVVTINGLKNRKTGNLESYSYRTVFENATVDDKFGKIKIKEISIGVPESLKKMPDKNIYEVSLDNTEKIRLIAKINEDAEDNLVKWSSSNPEIIEVTQNGTLKVKKASSLPVTITVCSDYNNDIKASIMILPSTVRVQLEETNIELMESQEKTLKALLSNGENVNVTWLSSRPEIVEVDSNGKLTPKSGGVATVTATSEKYGEASTYVYVCIPINLADGSKAYVGDMNRDGFFNSIDSSMILEVAMGNGNRDYYYVADVNGDGFVNSTDSAILLDWYKNQLFSPGKYYPITEIKINSQNITINIGKKIDLIATIFPENTTDSTKISWESNNNNIASVDDTGKVTAINNGTTIITAKTTNGKIATCNITVTEKHNLIGDVNGDEKVSLIDYAMVLAHVKRTTLLTGEELSRADVNGDGKVTLIDYAMILAHVKRTTLLW